MTFLKSVSALVVSTFCWNNSFAALAPGPTNPPISIDAEAILNDHSEVRGEITRALQDQKVLTELAKMGIEKKEVEQRLAAMSDQELQQVKDGVQRTAGGDVVVLSLTAVLLIIIIVILIVK